ncbi:DNA J protein C72 [Hibiscus trionum]|uniref:DNA J protein C72 n=1 Tax=Hibiscus trionum TaxID=183268 RepID=A0A9W7GZD6_HIBTR|nr:DNA J protein C72 [Hibiscus trionum]
MQISRCRNIFLLKNSLIPAFLPAKQTPDPTATTHVGSFHSTPFTCEKWKNKWNFDKRSSQQPAKSYGRYAVRQKRAEAKRDLRNLLFSGRASNISFQDEDPIWKFDGTDGWNSDGSVKKNRSTFSGRRAGKSNRRKSKRRFRRESFSEDFDNPETIFEAAFGNKWYTWSFRGDFTFRNSESGFEWREKSDWSNQRTEEQETTSEREDEDEAYAVVGSCSDREILGLPPTGRLKLEDVKKAFRLSALKWHPDKHQGSSQAVAEEKFKTCVAAYKSLCHALA